MCLNCRLGQVNFEMTFDSLVSIVKSWRGPTHWWSTPRVQKVEHVVHVVVPMPSMVQNVQLRVWYMKLDHHTEEEEEKGVNVQVCQYSTVRFCAVSGDR